MEDIKKAIEEEVKRTSCFEDVNELVKYNTKTLRLVDIRTFQRGANFILSKWQESTRWRKVEEELPEKKDKGYFILVRSGDIMDAYYVYPDTNYEYLRDWKEWKPIH